MQLNLLKLITDKDRDSVISLAVKYMSLKMKMKYTKRRRFAFFRRVVNGVEVENMLLILTSEEFSKNVESQISKLDIRLSEKGFSYY